MISRVREKQLEDLPFNVGTCGPAGGAWQPGQSLVELSGALKSMLMTKCWPGKNDAFQGRDQLISLPVAFACITYLRFRTI